MWPTSDACQDLWQRYVHYRDEVRLRYLEAAPVDPRRDSLLALWQELTELGEALQGLLAVPVDVQPLQVEPRSARVAVPVERPEPTDAVKVGAHRRMGEDTQAWYAGKGRVPMRRNKGPQ